MFSTPLLRGSVCPIFLFLSETLKRLRGSAEIQPLCSDLRSEATVLPIFFKVSWCLFCPILPAAYFMCLDNTAAHLWLESARRGKADDQSSSSG